MNLSANFLQLSTSDGLYTLVDLMEQRLILPSIKEREVGRYLFFIIHTEHISKHIFFLNWILAFIMKLVRFSLSRMEWLWHEMEVLEALGFYPNWPGCRAFVSDWCPYRYFIEYLWWIYTPVMSLLSEKSLT